MDVTAFDALPEAEARALVGSWLGVARWVEDVLAGRPYAARADLAARAHAAALHLTDDELAEALAHHPRIGDRPDAERARTDPAAAHSRAEQAGLAAAHDGGPGESAGDSGTARRLRAGNAAYEARFGHVFLVRAAGRTGAEILAELDRRLGNDPAAEREETVTALREIALLRLESAVTDPAPAGTGAPSSGGAAR